MRSRGEQGCRGFGPTPFDQERDGMDEELVDRHWKALEELRKSAEMYDDPVIDQRIMELTLTSKMILESEENEPEERVR